MAYAAERGQARSAIGREDGFKAEYDLPSAIGVDDGLTLRAYRGTRAVGYSWTGSVHLLASHQQ